MSHRPAYCPTARMIKRKPSFSLYAALLLIGSLSALATLATPLRAAETLILGFGDSLMAGYQLPQSDSFPAQLERHLRTEDGMDVRVENAGVSGDTTTGGRSRLDWVLAGLDRAPDLVILELGANDALRGIDPAITRENLAAMIETIRQAGSRVLLAGMRAPPNMGAEYEAAFNRIYPELAEEYDIPLYPFFLDGVAAQPDLNLDDGMHPNAEGIAIMVDRITPYIHRTLKRPKPQAVKRG